MRENPYFSVVMPVYNAEKYVAKAIKSVLDQTFRDFELILIDDCSTDGSYDICREYSERDERVTLVKTDYNKGVSNARNLGIKFVKGQYCTFIDSDDWVDEDLLDHMFDALREHHVDIIKYGVCEEYFDREEYKGAQKFLLEDKKMKGSELKEIVPAIWSDSLFSYLCNGVYSVQNLELKKWVFDTNMIAGEDILINLSAFNRAESLCTMRYCGYHYAKREKNSLSTNLTSEEYIKDYGKCIEKMKEYCITWGVLSRRNKIHINWIYLKFYYQALYRCEEIDKNSIDKIRQTLRSGKYVKNYENDIFQNNIKKKIVDKIFRIDSVMLDKIFTMLLVIMKKRFRVFMSKIKG